MPNRLPAVGSSSSLINVADPFTACCARSRMNSIARSVSRAARDGARLLGTQRVASNRLLEYPPPPLKMRGVPLASLYDHLKAGIPPQKGRGRAIFLTQGLVLREFPQLVVGLMWQATIIPHCSETVTAYNHHRTTCNQVEIPSVASGMARARD